MLELMLSCLVTLVPDILYRRFAQGKRLGYEITFFNVWYELRWGISCCAVLAISLIRMGVKGEYYLCEWCEIFLSLKI